MSMYVNTNGMSRNRLAMNRWKSDGMCLIPYGQLMNMYCCFFHVNAVYCRDDADSWNWKYASLRSNSPNIVPPASVASMSLMRGIWNRSFSSKYLFNFRTSRHTRMPRICPCSSFFGTTSSGELNLQLSVTRAIRPSRCHRCSSSSTTVSNE